MEIIHCLNKITDCGFLQGGDQGEQKIFPATETAESMEKKLIELRELGGLMHDLHLFSYSRNA
jgi:hypothetical protein